MRQWALIVMASAGVILGLVVLGAAPGATAWNRQFQHNQLAFPQDEISRRVLNGPLPSLLPQGLEFPSGLEGSGSHVTDNAVLRAGVNAGALAGAVAVCWAWTVRKASEVQIALAALMEERGWTLAALSDALGVHENTLRRWYRGEYMPANAGPVLAMLRQLQTARVPRKRRAKRK
jgi:hypothetical protein